VLTFGAQILMGLALIVGTHFLGGGVLRGGIIGNTGAASFGALVLLPLITLGIISAATAYELAKQLTYDDSAVSWTSAVWALGILAPYINIVVALALNWEANSWCRLYGVKVGLLGPTKDGLRRLQAGKTTGPESDDRVESIPNPRDDSSVLQGADSINEVRVEDNAATREVSARADFAGTLRAATPVVWVTPAIVGVNVVVFAAMIVRGVSPTSPSTADLFRWAASFGPAVVVDGQWWRLLSSVFVHIGLLHLVFNMYALWGVGAVVERVYGNVAFLALYLAAGLTGSLIAVIWLPMAICAGASGAVFGVYGAILAFRVTAHDSQATNFEGLTGGTLVFLFYNLIYGLTQPNIANAAHLGGLVAGFVAGLLLARDLEAPPEASRRRFIRAAALVPVLGGLAWGAHYRVATEPSIQASEAATAGNWIKAAALFRRACDGGTGMACAKLGYLYEFGRGVPKDLLQSQALAKRACDQGEMRGCTLLGGLYESGQGIRRNLGQAAALYEKACDGGEKLGCGKLGVLLEDGQGGVTKDVVRAAALYNQACDGGYLIGCANLGIAYLRGQGVPKDQARATALFKEACAGGVEYACNRLKQ
jgi:membrane associated rhomboid family serine protease